MGALWSRVGLRLVPIRLLSDRESSFHEQVMLGLTALLTSRQGWGLAGAPQGHGDVERVHREVHKDLGRAVESVAEVTAADWPEFLDLVAANWNQKTIDGDVTPFALRCGFFGTSRLSTVLGALAAAPRGLEVTQWMKTNRAVHALLMKHFEEAKAAKAAVRAATRNDEIRPRQFRSGDTVLLERLKTTVKPGHKMQGRSTGPWKVTSVTQDGGAVELEDAFTGAPLRT